MIPRQREPAEDSVSGRTWPFALIFPAAGISSVGGTDAVIQSSHSTQKEPRLPCKRMDRRYGGPAIALAGVFS